MNPNQKPDNRILSTIRVNGKETKKASNLLFGDLVNNLNNELSNSKQVISEIRIDGKAIDEALENKISMKQLGQLGHLEFITSDPLELAFEALRSAQAYIKRIIPHCQTTGHRFLKRELRQAEKDFAEVVNSLDNLTDILASAQYVLKGKISVSHTNDSSLRIAQVRLVSAIHELLPAKTNNDYVMLADVLINELPDALREMSELGIPVLMRLQST